MAPVTWQRDAHGMEIKKHVIDIAATISLLGLIAWRLYSHLTPLSNPNGFVWWWWGRILAWNDPWANAVLFWRGPITFGLEITPIYWLIINRKWCCSWLRKAFRITH
jgi:hypothetical protein